MKNILIAGATGTAGSSITETLTADMYRISGITSRKEGIRALKSLNCRPCQVDLTRKEEVNQIFSNEKPEIVVSSVLGRGLEATKQEQQMVRNLIAMAQAHDVQKFVYISVLHSNKQTGVPHFEIKGVLEQELKASGIPWLIIRPCTFMNSLLSPWFLQPIREQNIIQSPFDPDIEISYIHTLDVADVIAYSLQCGLKNKVIEIGGEPLSLRYIQKVIGDIKGKKPGIQRISSEDVQQMMGEDIRKMVDYFNTNGFRLQINQLPKGFDQPLRTFEQEIKKHI